MRKFWFAAVLSVLAAGVPAGLAAAAPSQVAPVAVELDALRGYDISGDPAAALRHVDAVLARAAAAPAVDPIALLYARAIRAQALSELDRTEEALALFTEVDAALEARGAPPTLDRASLLLHIGGEHGALGRLDEAEAYSRRALALAERLGGRTSAEYGDALYGIGVVAYQRGRQRDALAPVAESLAIARARALATGERPESPASRGVSLSALQLYAGDAQDAVVTAREAAAWAEAHLPENHRIRATATQQLGTILSEAGQYAQAIPILRAALEKRRAILPPDSPQLAMSIHSLAYALDNAGLRAEAGPLYDRAVAIFEAHPDRLQASGLATMIGQQARAAAWAGDAAASLAMREKALSIARRYAASPEDPVVLNAEINLASALSHADRREEAAALLAHAREGYAKVAGPGTRGRIAAAAVTARLIADEGRPAQAAAMLGEALAPARARLLDRATARSDIMGIAADTRSAFMDLVRVCAQAGRQAEVFDALQMVNLGDLQGAFSSLGLLREEYGPEAREAIRRYLALAAQGRQLRKSLDQAAIQRDPAATADLGTRIAALEEQVRAADAELSSLVPGYRALTAVEPARLADARARLRPGQGLLLIGNDDGGLVSQLVTRGGVALGQSSIAARRLVELQQRLRASVEGGLLDQEHAGFDRQAAHELYRVIVPQALRPLLGSVRELVVLAPGSLATIPFAALVTQPPRGDDADPAALRRTRWLVRDHAVSVMISAAPLPRPAREARGALAFAGIGAPLPGAPAEPAAGTGTPVKSDTMRGIGQAGALARLAALPDAARELQDMASRFSGPTRLLIGASATETALKQAPLEQARVIAFATHGLVGGALRGVVEPALVLTPPLAATAQDDGLLTASEVAQLRLDADWVILSACDTSAGESENAPTYSGLARAFISAGSRALLLSHWPVRDDVASRLTLRTLEEANAGQSRAQALRTAQLSVLRDASIPGGAHPAAWAPFVLVGD